MEFHRYDDASRWAVIFHDDSQGPPGWPAEANPLEETTLENLNAPRIKHNKTLAAEGSPLVPLFVEKSGKELNALRDSLAHEWQAHRQRRAARIEKIRLQEAHDAFVAQGLDAATAQARATDYVSKLPH